VEQLEGRVAVVTGGASGIGRALAARFVAEGMRVAIADVEAGPLEATAAELGALAVRTDVRDPDAVQALADRVVDELGGVHVVCNNAGVGGGGLMKDATLNDWRWVLEVNLWGVVHGLHAFLPHLLANEDGGHVVNTASLAGLMPAPGIGPYAASKYAVVGLSEALRDELAADGARVGVSVLCPGYVRTNIFRSQRNRPAELRDDRPKPQARQANDAIIEQVAQQAIEPEAVAAQVLDAIRADRFWVITHPDMVEPYLRRHDEIVASLR
jgi:NAD(P)-dependent dehydrogenase (short-subunit alcohol dehydrogenase family)